MFPVSEYAENVLYLRERKISAFPKRSPLLPFNIPEIMLLEPFIELGYGFQKATLKIYLLS